MNGEKRDRAYIILSSILLFSDKLQIVPDSKKSRGQAGNSLAETLFVAAALLGVGVVIAAARDPFGPAVLLSAGLLGFMVLAKARMWHIANKFLPLAQRFLLRKRLSAAA